jgi:hypothetical protein
MTNVSAIAREVEECAKLAYEAFSGDIFNPTDAIRHETVRVQKSGPPPISKHAMQFERLPETTKATWRKVAVVILNYDRTNYNVTIKKEEKRT